MKKTSTLNIAHRGARSIAPENTLLAAQKALAIGADLWELDVAMTADEEVVVIHDDSLERTSNAALVFPDRSPWKVETFTLKELRALDFGSWYIQTDPFKQIAGGIVSSDEQREFVSLRIPTLLEALEFTRNAHWRVNIEIKDLSAKPGDAAIVDAVCKLVKTNGMIKSIIISSFKHSYLSQIKAVNPEIVTAALVEDPVPDPVQLLKYLNAQAYNPNIDTLKFEQIKTVTAAGFDVFIWTVNDLISMHKLVDAGVSGIFTDFPQLLKPILENHL
jgi:glycerophosphoryl diester phosphodiesterase